MYFLGMSICIGVESCKDSQVESTEIGTLKCISEDCEKGRYYGLSGQDPLYCATHKLDNMVKRWGRICQIADCNENAFYNHPKQNHGKFCKSHKSPEMVYIGRKICKEENCLKTPFFNLPSNKEGLYCSGHKKEGMINIKHPSCKTCGIYAYFNVPGEKQGIFCETHKTEDMINVRAKQCLESGCTFQPSFNVIGKTNAIYCSKHRKENMINLRKTTCGYTGCEGMATFNKPGLKAKFCNEHKSVDMVSVQTRKKCLNCEKVPSYNFCEEKLAIYCKQHMIEGMVNIFKKTCIEKECMNRPSYNFTGLKDRLYCSNHKVNGMINLNVKQCTSCTSRVSYGKLFQEKIHCAQHKEANEYANNNPKCEFSKCKAKPFYTDSGNYPKRCETHKEILDINIVEQPCNNCGLSDLINDKTKLCNSCCEYHTVRKVQELFVGKALKAANFILESSDVKVIDGCSKYRPDFVIDYPLFKVIVECDENQHKSYSNECEIGRMRQIFQDFGGTPVIFIRYNPDKYMDKTQKKHNTNRNRISKLIQLMNELKNYTEWNKFLCVFYMFYDGYDGTNNLIEIDPIPKY